MKQTDKNDALIAEIAAMPQLVRTGSLPAQKELKRPLANLGELWFFSPVMARMLQNGAQNVNDLPARAADFEKLAALFAALPRLGGTPIAEDLAADLAALDCSLCPTSAHAAAIWQQTALTLSEHPLTPADLLFRMNVRVVDLTPTMLQCGTPLPQDTVPLLSFPSLLSTTAPTFAEEVRALGAACGTEITDLPSLEHALLCTLRAAKEQGSCVIALSLCDTPLFVRPDPYHAAQALQLALSGKGAHLQERDAALLHAQLLRILGRLAVENGYRFLWELVPKIDTVSAPFSPVALQKLLHYLDEWQALPSLCLSLSPAQCDGGLAPLFGAFPDEGGVSRLLFGIAGQGATAADLARAVRFFARHGATTRCIGLTDARTLCLQNGTAARFAAALADELVYFDDADFAKAEARALLYERPARFFGVQES